MKIWTMTKEFFEGKYLVLRRDGTIPEWPHFVLGGNDPAAPAALMAYARAAEELGFEREYVDSARELADRFASRVGRKSDPEAPPHRKDDEGVILLMRNGGSIHDEFFRKIKP
jgi:hypothetical protein